MKIIITGSSNIDKYIIAKQLVEDNDDLNLSQLVTDDKECDEEGIMLIDTQLLYSCFQNNAFLYLEKIENNYYGITLDDFYNSDITYMSLQNFNKISNKVFKEYDILVIWVDSNKNNSNLSSDILEMKYFLERLDKIKYVYFLDEDEKEISKIINDYLDEDEDGRKKILEEYS